MERADWAAWERDETVKRRAGGRRRHNAERQRRAWERRQAIAEWLAENPAWWWFPRGVPGLLAPAFGVHPSTIWRDLQVLLYPPAACRCYSNGELLFTVYRAYPGGPVVGLEDACGNEIRGEARRRIIRALPRYRPRRRRQRLGL